MEDVRDLICDEKTREFKPLCLKALRRIFYLLDKDDDGSLTDEDLRPFNYPFDVINTMRLLLPIGVDHRGLNLNGFICLHEMFVWVGESRETWRLLGCFGYNRSLRLDDELFLLPKISSDENWELTNAAVHFLRGVFNKYKSNADECLGPQQLEELFLNTPENPWNEAPYRDAVERKSGGLTLFGFLSLWDLMALIDPKRCIEYLMYIGSTDLPAPAIRIIRRKTLDQKNKVSYQHVYHCFIFGPKEAGKTALLDSFIDRPFSEEYTPTTVDRYAVKMIEMPKVNSKTLVLHEVPQEDAKKLLQSEDALAACDIAVIVYDTSSARSREEANKLHLDIACYGDNTGHEIPCLIVAAKCDLEIYFFKASHEPGTYAPIPTSAKLGRAMLLNVDSLFCKILWTALSATEKQQWSDVNADSLDVSAWEVLISETEKMLERTSEDNIRNIRKVYDAFLAKFPLSFIHWQRYVNHELSIGSTDRVMQLYDCALVAVKGFHCSVDICLRFIDFATQNCEDPIIRRVYERCLNDIGTDYHSSTLWDACIKFEYERGDWCRMATLYTRALQCPKQNLDHYIEGFRELVAAQPLPLLLTAEEFALGNVNLEEYISSRENTFHKTKQCDLFQNAILEPYCCFPTYSAAGRENSKCIVAAVLSGDKMDSIYHLMTGNYNPLVLKRSLLLAARNGTISSYIDYFNAIEATRIKYEENLLALRARNQERKKKVTTLSIWLERHLTLPCALDVEDETRWSAVFCAVYGNQPRMLKFLIKILKLKVDAHDIDGNSLLHVAASCLSYEAAAYMIQEGHAFPFVNVPNNEGYTPLLLALSYSVVKGSGNFVNLLLESGSDVNYYGNCGTPLHLAAMRGDEEAVGLLLKWNASVNVVSPQGYTPLVCALFSKSHKCVDLLLGAGAHTSVQSEGYSALEISVLSKQLEVSKLLRRYGCSDNSSMLQHAIHAVHPESKWEISNWDYNDISRVSLFMAQRILPDVSWRIEQAVHVGDGGEDAAFVKAIHLCTIHLLSEPNDSEIKFTHAHCWYKMGLYREALYHILKMNSEHPFHADAARLAGLIKEQLKEHVAAYRSYCKAADLHDEYATLPEEHYQRMFPGDKEEILTMRMYTSRGERPNRGLRVKNTTDGYTPAFAISLLKLALGKP